MADFGAQNIKSLRFTLTSPTTATSGNVPISYNAIPVVGRIVGLEIGSPAFDTNTGSLYMFASGATFAQNRLVLQINGLAQARTYYPIIEYQRNNIQGTLVSGTAFSAYAHPIVDGDQIGITTSGTYNGTSVPIIVHFV